MCGLDIDSMWITKISIEYKTYILKRDNTHENKVSNLLYLNASNTFINIDQRRNNRIYL